MMGGYLYSENDEQYLRDNYADKPNRILAQKLKRSPSAVLQKARKMGLSKSHEFFSKPENLGQFTPGHATYNKGMKRGNLPGSMETQFKAGSKPHTWKPVGSLRIDRDGYHYQKVSDTGRKSDWQLKHVIIWLEANGEIPPDHIVVFKNRDKSDLRLDNLECITRAENMRRNTLHRYPTELKRLLKLNGKLLRTIKQREQAHEK